MASDVDTGSRHRSNLGGLQRGIGCAAQANALSAAGADLPHLEIGAQEGSGEGLDVVPDLRGLEAGHRQF